MQKSTTCLLPDESQTHLLHYGDVIMGTMASEITGLTIVYKPFIRVQIKENIIAPLHWPLCGEFTRDRWVHRTNGQERWKCFHLLIGHLMTSSWIVNVRDYHCSFDYYWFKPFRADFFRGNIDGLVQDSSNSIAHALELLQPCTKPLA